MDHVPRTRGGRLAPDRIDQRRRPTRPRRPAGARRRAVLARRRLAKSTRRPSTSTSSGPRIPKGDLRRRNQDHTTARLQHGSSAALTQLSADGASVERPGRTIGRCVSSRSRSALPSSRRRSRQHRGGQAWTQTSPAAEYSAAVTRICAGGAALRRCTSDGHPIRRALDRRRHPSLDRSTPRARHRPLRPTRAPAHQQPLDLVTTPARVALSRQRGSASTTPSTPPAPRHSRPLLLNASRSSCMHLTIGSAAGRLELELHVPDCTGGG